MLAAGCAAFTCQDSFNTCCQLGKREWLGDIIICANRETAQNIGFIVSGSEHDDRRVAHFTDALERFPAIHLRHGHIQYDQVGFALEHFAQASAPVISATRSITLPAEEFTKQAA